MATGGTKIANQPSTHNSPVPSLSRLSRTTAPLPLLAPPSLDENDRALVDLLGAKHVVNSTEEQDGNKHDTSPVESGCVCGRVIRPEAPEERVRRIQDSNRINGHAPPAQTPACRRQQLRVVDAAVEDAADGRHVRDHQRNDVERDDGVESGVGTDVDEREKYGEGACDQDCVGGDFEFGIDFGDPVGPG